MTYTAREESRHDGTPWEAFWFSSVLQNYRYVSGDKPRTILGQVFEPEAISCSGLEQGEELTSQSLTVTIPITCALAGIMRGYFPPRPVSLVIYRGHDGEAEQVTYYTGVVASSRRQGGRCELTILPEREALRRSLPAASFQRQCIRRLGSARCGVDLNAYMVSTALTVVSGRTVTSPDFASKPDGYFNAGWIEALGTAMAISAHVGNTLTLKLALPGLEVGAAVVAYPGCQGTESECADKFNNLPNHLGWARFPGTNPFGEGGIR